jgi:hypothetical protein
MICPYGVGLGVAIVELAVVLPNDIKFPLESIEATFTPAKEKYILVAVVVIAQLLGNVIDVKPKFVVLTLVALTVVTFKIPLGNEPL